MKRGFQAERLGGVELESLQYDSDISVESELKVFPIVTLSSQTQSHQQRLFP